MDIQMPGCGGVDATRRIVAADPAVRVLIVTMFEDDASLFTAVRAGARGFVLKDAERADILRAVRAVGQGEAIFSPAVATRLIDYFNAPARSPAAAEFPELTDREREILELIAQGARNPDIARRLVLSPNTVRNYVSSIFAKLQVADRAHAIIRARKAGLGGS
jgi:DNA-binding NarL/FixJ family response regulator